MINIVGREQLDEFIISNVADNMVLVLYFGASWCGPCKQLKQRLADADTQINMPKLVVAHIDIDEEENDKIVKCYKITSLPTQVFIKLNGSKVVEISRIEGYDFIKFKFNYDSYLV